MSTTTVKLNGDYLIFDAYINHLDKNNFKQRGCKIIQIGDSLRGIVFNISNDDLEDSFVKITPGSPISLNLKAMVNNTNELNWKIGDYVRIMYLNEIDYRDFEKLIPYFEARLSYYKYDDPKLPTSTKVGYQDFSKMWSTIHPDNMVDDLTPLLSPKPRQTTNDDILAII